jgi:hypothetical protein
MINPTDYPTKVLSTQFDVCLLADRLADTTESEDDTSGQFGSRMSVSKLPLFIIVAEASCSGRSSVSATLSVHLSDTPIIVLANVWRSVFAREDATQADLVAALTDVITQSASAGGFVVDGLDGLPEHSDIDQFLHHALKMRGLDAELPQNPFYII